ncbi:LysR substrate-binding domain-containing protein [Shewanella corallii]|uniref:LysR substrate-binding domain-containing protein n=2 Tax=Shewanella TaxID=22 RepID=A0ABT0NAH2_9GAMM|nr:MULTISPECIES: LysR family transcriptional regulator [Shewanella]MCL1038823.1 LysR substrate-binding domain-containing protein [Shewanella submarina]MCL2915140.1 LysR substrate-binding domain-containing protein [Shewanella corallii]
MDASQLYRMLVFATVVEQGSFTRAADKLGVSRSMVSQHLKKLETRLDNKLLERTTRKVSLTDAGRQFYQYCAELLQLAEQAENAALPSSAELQGSLKVCVPHALGQSHLLPRLGEFARQYPKLKINLQLEDMRLNLEEHHIDLAIYAGQARGATSSGLDQQWQHLKLSEYREILVASPEYIAGHGRPIHPDNLEQHHWICSGHHLMPRPMVLANSDNEEFRIRITPAQVCNQAVGILQMVMQGMGMAPIAESLVKGELAAGRLERLLPDYHLNQGGVFLTHRFEEGMPPKVRAFAEFLSQKVYSC